MSNYVNQSFTYDPAMQGYDTNSWKTISGAPDATGGRLIVDTGAGFGAAIHYVDAQKGDIVFDVNIPAAPGLDSSRYFGVANALTTKHVWFMIGSTLRCEISDGTTTTTSGDIEWNDDWTGEDTEFRIIWEAGLVKFLINGTRVYSVSNTSIPYGPLSLYIADESGSPMTFGDISVLGTQSYVLNPKTDDDVDPIGVGKRLGISQAITITENVSLTVV